MIECIRKERIIYAYIDLYIKLQNHLFIIESAAPFVHGKRDIPRGNQHDEHTHDASRMCLCRICSGYRLHVPQLHRRTSEA